MKRLTIDGAVIARALIDSLDPMGAAARAAAAAFVELARELEAFRPVLRRVVRRHSGRRRGRARYEIREAILARRLGINPEPWRGQ